MAFGDIGGTVTELIVTCRTPAEGTVAIRKGDALTLSGDYTVAHATADDDPIFGEALADVALNAFPIPVKLRGIASFAYTGDAPTVDGVAGVALSATAGKVKKPATGTGRGTVLKVDPTAGLLHVLL